MGTRRALVLDDDLAFIDFLRSALGEYGFDVQQLDTGAENLQALNTIQAQILFISADLPENAGFAYCSRARKTIGKNILIVLITAMLSADDLSIHQKQKHHANLYLDKRDLTAQDLITRLDEVIQLGSRTGLPSTLSGDQIEPSSSGNDTAKLDGLEGNTSERGLNIQRKEIFNLLRNLEEAYRDARSSPFSHEFVKLRDIIDGKDFEISTITEQLNDSYRQIKSLKERNEALDTEIIELQEKYTFDIEQVHKVYQESLETTRHRLEEELSEANTSHREALDQSQQEHAAQIDRIQSEGDAKIEALKQSIDGQKRTFEQEHQDIVTELNEAHDELFELIEAENKADIDDLKSEIEETQQVLETERASFRSEIESLKSQHIEAIRQIQDEKDKALSAVQQADQNLKNAEQEHQKIINELKQAYTEQIEHMESNTLADIDALKTSVDAAHQALGQEREILRSKIETLESRHAETIQKVQEEKNSVLSAVQQQADEKLKKVEKDYQETIEKLKQAHAEQIELMKSESNTQIDTLKKSETEQTKHAIEQVR